MVVDVVILVVVVMVTVCGEGSLPSDRKGATTKKMTVDKMYVYV